MATIEVTDECKKMLDVYAKGKRTYTEVIMWLKEEVFSRRMSSITDSDMGRVF